MAKVMDVRLKATLDKIRSSALFETYSVESPMFNDTKNAMNNLEWQEISKEMIYSSFDAMDKECTNITESVNKLNEAIGILYGPLYTTLVSLESKINSYNTEEIQIAKLKEETTLSFNEKEE